MTVSITELERSLRALRVSGMTTTLETRALQVAQSQMDFIEAFSALVQDELDRRRSRLIDRRFALSELLERKNPKDFDWPYSKVPVGLGKKLRRSCLAAAISMPTSKWRGAKYS
jgi:hypothetical protein